MTYAIYLVRYCDVIDIINGQNFKRRFELKCVMYVKFSMYVINLCMYVLSSICICSYVQMFFHVHSIVLCAFIIVLLICVTYYWKERRNIFLFFTTAIYQLMNSS